MPLIASRRICGVLPILGLCGCANFHIGDPAVRYRAFGDSITRGSGLPNGAQDAYPALVAGAMHIKVNDYATGGDQACDIAARQIFPHGENPSLALHAISTILIGTNDVDGKGVGPHERVFTDCQMAVIAWQAVPAEYKVLATSPRFKTSGPGRFDTFAVTNVWTTQGDGASESFIINLEKTASVYAWPLIDDSSDAAYDYALDGQVVGKATTRIHPSMHTGNGTTRSVGFLRIPRVTAGRHEITFRQTSSGVDGVSILAVGSSTVHLHERLPVVLVGTIPLQMQTGKDRGCQLADGPCLQYIEDIKENIRLLSSDGLDVRLFDTRKYMFATASEMMDALHPNGLGQRELAESVQAVWPLD